MSAIIDQKNRWPVLAKQMDGSDCMCMCCSGFFRIEDLTALGPPSINNPVHPLFAEAKCNDIDFDDVKPSAQLATLLLEATLPFWYNLMYGKIRQIIGLAADGFEQYEIYDHIESLDPIQQMATRERLKELSKYLTIHRNEKRYFSTVPETRISGNDFFHGYRSKIFISSTMLDILDDPDDPVQGYWAAAKVAFALLHELAHAVSLAQLRHVNPDNHMFFGGSIVAEEGYEWEKRTFGGILEDTYRPDHLPPNYSSGRWAPHSQMYTVDGISSSLKSIITLEEFPNLSIAERYAKEGSQISVRQGATMQQAFMRWNVPFSYIYGLFQRDFWLVEYKARGPAALRPTKTTGFRFQPSADRTRSEQFLSWWDTAVPEGYQLAENGLIIPQGTTREDFLEDKHHK